MNKRINDAINNTYDNYMLPFVWLHGESKERVKEEILAVKNSGVSAFCAESRPYEKFCRDEWWDDFRFILETARELDMKVWLLDDRHFPTGYANGYLESEERAHLRKVNIRIERSEVAGPRRKVKILTNKWIKNEKDEQIISVHAYRHTDSRETLDYESAIDLTPTLNDGAVYWDVPEGVWRICVCIRTGTTYEEGHRYNYYIDMLREESCRAMIDAIYQPHYDRFSEFFGTTFMGFFSDEPGMLNSSHTYLDKLGLVREAYPWRDDLPSLIAESADIPEDEVKKALPALWENLGDKTALIRYHYMEVVSKLYSSNFCYALGNWCRDHGVMYIGHVIEDLNAHMRLGLGAGHFFRALDGQDMGGLDIVLMQDIPGITDCIHRAPLADDGYTNPALFHYTVPKMAVSHSHIQPLKKGRTMCEIFGAFGWAEGTEYMKQLADTMLVSGVNYFVPHAFSAKENDPDCPPHFYNGGKNIQYPLFGKLMTYMNRTSHILSGGTHCASVAVFYNADGEWTGGKNETFDFVCRNITQNLIDFDIIPYDYLKDAVIENRKFSINKESYKALIVSESEIMPMQTIKLFEKLTDCGIPVIFTNSLPSKSAEGDDISEITSKFNAVSTDNVGAYLRNAGLFEISASGENSKYLRFYHKKHENEDIYMFSNDAVCDTLNTYITLPQNGEYLMYDAWSNKYFRGNAENGKLHLILEKGNAVIIAFGSDIPENTPDIRYEKERIPLDIRPDIYLNGELYKKSSELHDITAPDANPDFYGEIIYKTEFIAKDGFTVLDLGDVGETAEVWLNGEYAGCRINAPYKFDISKAYTEKANSLEIKVRSNAGHIERDVFSNFIWLPPTGITGMVSLCKYN